MERQDLNLEETAGRKGRRKKNWQGALREMEGEDSEKVATIRSSRVTNERRRREG